VEAAFSSLSEDGQTSETRIVRSNLDLEQSLLDMIRKVTIPGLDLELVPQPRGFLESQHDVDYLLLRTEADGVTRSFTVECKIKASAADVDRLGISLKDSHTLLCLPR
jgi:hypothetical protein